MYVSMYVSILGQKGRERSRQGLHHRHHHNHHHNHQPPRRVAFSGGGRAYIGMEEREDWIDGGGEGGHRFCGRRQSFCFGVSRAHS